MFRYTRKTLAAKLGIGIETLRYYEKIDLIPPAERQGNGYRVYTDEDASSIEHIIVAKKYGFSLEEIRAIMGKAKKNVLTNGDMIKFFKSKIEYIDNQIVELKELKSGILEILKSYQE